jgi:UDP-N-acetyl-D-mannosaminuronic acid dehydrogenase
VGLPLGIAFAQAGAEVALLDIDEARVAEVAAGRMPFLEYGADQALPEVLASGRLRVTTSPQVIAETQNIIVTIGTPVDEYLDPGVRSFDRGLDRVLDRMRPHQLLILRSTVFPGVTSRLARRVAERGLAIDIAHCPERIAQAYALEELGKLPQIIGGVTPAATHRAAALFRLLGVKIVELPPIEAELAKLFANAYRYVNFAIANQLYVIAQKFSANFDRIHTAVTSDYPRMAGFSKAGFAGGPCLLKDTMQLGAFNHNAFVIGQAAMMVNEGLPSAVVEAVKAQRDLSRLTAAILGMAFKGNCDDPRSSLAYKLRKVLTLECRRVLCTDPYIDDPTFVPLEQALAEADIVFVGACHGAYRDLVITQPLVDVFSFIRPPAMAQRRAAA